MGSSNTENINKKSIALLFPGQGSQVVGMGKDFFEKFEHIRVYYEKANDILGYDIKSLIFNGPAETLAQTEYTQPSVFLTSYIIFKCLEKHCPNITDYIKFTAGHSLGEYTALCVSGALTFEDALKIVSIRGKVMAEVSKENPGGMVAILGVDKDEVMKLCEEVRSTGMIVEPVNFNTPQQIVVAGEVSGIEKLQEILNQRKIRNIKLNVSGAFHSSLMNKAQKIFSETLDKVIINNAFIPIIMNYDAKAHVIREEILENLKQQINHPVLWEDTIKYMVENKTEVFIEVGVSKVLSGMLKKVFPEKIILTTENLETFESCCNFIKENIIRS